MFLIFWNGKQSAWTISHFILPSVKVFRKLACLALLTHGLLSLLTMEPSLIETNQPFYSDLIFAKGVVVSGVAQRFDLFILTCFKQQLLMRHNFDHGFRHSKLRIVRRDEIILSPQRRYPYASISTPKVRGLSIDICCNRVPFFLKTVKFDKSRYALLWNFTQLKI